MVFIKKVLIQGFKSYKDQTYFEEFHEQVNCIVGRNGSGKSNFFAAIRFVLSDMTNLDREERQRLLHEGSGDTVLSAFVEIHFDNKDGRFPIEKEEVVLRRTIGLKKDEFILDKKRVTINDVINLLESAGFSRSNPYYIVQQGKVQALTVLKDSERLELLKEVAGARVYDERRKQSVKIMEDTKGKTEKINETLLYIDERLDELKDEKAELEAYRQLDKEKRALQYNIYDKELTETLSRLEKLESQRQQETSKANDIYELALAARERIRETEKQLKALSSQVQAYNKDKETLNEEKQDLIKEKANLQLKVKDSDSKLERERQKRDRHAKEIDSLEKEIKKTVKQLESITPKFEAEREREKGVNETLAERERRVTELYSKQGRSAQFKSKKERDDWIKKEVKQISSQVEQQKDQLETLRKEIQETKKLTVQNDNAIEELKATTEERKALFEEGNKKLGELKESRDQLSNKRKELWKKDGELETNIQTYKAELVKSERQLQSSVNKLISNGLLAANRIVEQYKIAGFYGPLIELFEVDDEYITAVEVTAGNSLFNAVVDTDDTAARILEILNAEKVACRITFMPLNKLNVRAIELPSTSAVKPMIDIIKGKPMFKKAFLQVFGKTVICRDLDTAATYARQHNLDCVTLDGDQVNKSGALTGGYLDVRTSRLETMKSVNSWKAKLEAKTDEAKKIKKVLQDIDKQVSAVSTEMQSMEEQRANSRNVVEQFSIELRNRQKNVPIYNETSQQKEQAAQAIEASLHELEETRKNLSEEIGTDLLSKLSDREQNELAELISEIATLKKEVIVSSTARAELEARKTESNNLLTTNLQPRLYELQDELNSINLMDLEQEVTQLNSDLAKVQTSIDDIATRIQAQESAYDENSKKIKDLKDSLDAQKNAELDQAKSLQKESERMEKLLNERSLLLQKKEESEAKIREIGSLPSTEVETYRTLDLGELMSKLHETNKKLKAFSHVNKKALDQFMHFTKQREELSSKKDKLTESAQSIEQLLAALDQKKDEAIERTFKGVAFHFSKIFSDLVPGGSGSLIMQKRADASGKPQFTGVSIKVRFSETDEEHLVGALSGGQKSLVALTLIFAIQRCDPAPFYLFDEIDSALDATYRARVARLIKQQSRVEKQEDGKPKVEITQFIVSTFRPELVKAAHKCYAISHRNKESSIAPISHDQAHQIIQEELGQAEEGAPEEDVEYTEIGSEMTQD